MITVKELIERLKELPEDCPVIIGYAPIRDVYLDEEFYFGMSDNKQMRADIGPAVVIE